MDLGCSAIVPGQYVAAIAANKLPKLLKLNQLEVFTILMGHPVHMPCFLTGGSLELAEGDGRVHLDVRLQRDLGAAQQSERLWISHFRLILMGAKFNG